MDPLKPAVLNIRAVVRGALFHKQTFKSLNIYISIWVELIPIWSKHNIHFPYTVFRL